MTKEEFIEEIDNGRLEQRAAEGTDTRVYRGLEELLNAYEKYHIEPQASWLKEYLSKNPPILSFEELL